MSAADDEGAFPLVSCLCVTEGRSEFMPWLLWNFDKQTWKNRELVVIDSSAQPFHLQQENVHVLRAPPGANVPVKRNMALEAARGEYIAWFDDDDWQHPQRLAKLVGYLRQDALLAAGSQHSFFINLQKGTCSPYRAPRGFIFNSAVFETGIAQSVRFDERITKGSDAPWMTALVKQLGNSARCLPREEILPDSSVRGFLPLSAWLCHERNLSNPASRRRSVLPLSCVRDAAGKAWEDTDRQLSALRGSLSNEHVRTALEFRSVPSAPCG